jgi:ketosteroid isomerase-like protein
MPERSEDLTRQAQRYEDLVRRGYDAYNRGDYDAMDELLHPEVVWDSGDTSLDGNPIKTGIEAVKHHLMPDIFESQQANLEVVRVNGNKVFVETTFKVRTSGTGIELETRGFQVWTVEDEKARRVQLFLNREPALAAAGLT